MSSTDKILGTIGALNTLIDNFPMSILDLFQGKKYTSILEFIIDVLYACNVPVNEIVEWLLKHILSIEVHIEEGLSMDKLNEYLSRGDYRTREDSGWVRGLDLSIKSILMALLSSLYGCSSIPVLPNKVMDYPDPSIFSGASKTDKEDTPKIAAWDVLWRHQIYPARFDIPASLIDPIGMLSITPTSQDGRLYYDVDGADVYYRKKETTLPGSMKNTNLIDDIKLYFKKITEEDKIYVQLTSDDNIFEDINITMEYLDGNGNNLLLWNTVIKTYNNLSDRLLIKKGDEIKIGKIINIKINGSPNEYIFKLINHNIRCYFSYEKSEEYLFEFKNYNIFNNIVWFNEKTIPTFTLGATTMENNDDENTPSITDDGFYSGEDEEPVYYIYEVLKEKPKDFKKAKRMASAPTTANENSPDLVVVYEGTNPNDLYKTYDMNAFIWYTLNRSTRTSQIDINHTMWDSRLRRYRNTGKNLEPEDINNWYNSKKNATDEFLNVTDNNRIVKKDIHYPILQLKKSPNNLYGVAVSFPAQRYYKPTYRKKIINGKENAKGKMFAFNKSIYEFNWDYLESIQILKPRLLLANFINYLTDGLINEAANADFNITKQIIKNKISTATKKILEADDGVIEDCYSTFSNDEFDTMLEEMLLAREKMTYYGGNQTKVKVHDVDSYISSIDSINKSSTRNESITKITKLIEDVSAVPAEEGYRQYVFETSFDKSIFNKIIWALVMPIVDSLFTPQVMLLIIINMNLTGAVKISEYSKNDLGVILNLIYNKIMGLIKAIIKVIINKIVEMLYQLLLQKIMPMLIKWMAALKLEELRNWLNILVAGIACIPTLELNINPTKLGGIDEVNYADIINTGTTSTPESAAPSC